MVFLVNIRFSFCDDFSVAEGTGLSERVEARSRLLQPYDEEVTIRRTLSRGSKSGGFQAADEK
jgi:hypothetical protein